MKEWMQFLALAAFALFSTAPDLSANHAQYYVLDGFGGVHAGGGAPVISPSTTYFGFDIAKDLAFVAQATSISVGDSILVLDGFGGVHAGGALASDAPSPGTPYFGFDIARAIAYRNVPPRASNGSTDRTDVSTTSTSFISIESTSLFLPDDGYVLIIGTTSLAVTTGQGVLGVGVDGTTLAGNLQFFEYLAGNASTNFRTVTVSHMVFLTAGSHDFNFLLRARNSGDAITYNDTSLSAIFIDHDASGFSIQPPNQNLGGPDGGVSR